MMVYGIGSTALAEFFVTIGLLLQILFCWAKLEKKQTFTFKYIHKKHAEGKHLDVLPPS